jgi:hypothetical protein
MGDRGGLGDLEDQPVGGNAGLAQPALDELHQPFVSDRAGGEVDFQAQVATQRALLCQLADRAFNDPAVDLADHAQGWPIATGIIEGACRHLVKDRMDITGARWGLAGAETVLKLRAIKANGDFDSYWRYHLDQERHHIHEARYLDHAIPQAT